MRAEGGLPCRQVARTELICRVPARQRTREGTGTGVMALTLANMRQTVNARRDREEYIIARHKLLIIVRHRYVLAGRWHTNSKTSDASEGSSSSPQGRRGTAPRTGYL